MSYKYPENHPVQTIRAKKMWGILNNSYDHFMPMYEDGINMLYMKESEPIPSENEVLYLSEDIDNWNEGLNRNLHQTCIYAMEFTTLLPTAVFLSTIFYGLGIISKYHAYCHTAQVLKNGMI